MPFGRIVKALSGFYYVLPNAKEYHEENLIQCRARGIFRKKGESPLVGDMVAFDVVGTREGTVTSIEERKNELIRPPIANVELAVLVFSLAEPAFSPLLLDRFLVHSEKANIPALICLTKADLVNESIIIKIKEDYQGMGYPVLATSAKKHIGIESLLQHLKGKISVFAGQSGVGKSSLLNELIPSLSLKTAEISIKLGRGKHTTRHVELLPIDSNSWVADTPGFSQLDFLEMEPEELSHYFIEMREHIPNCKFRGCLHASEPGCAVRNAVETGEIILSRYEHYLEFLQEVKEAKQRRY